MSPVVKVWLGFLSGDQPRSHLHLKTNCWSEACPERLCKCCIMYGSCEGVRPLRLQQPSEVAATWKRLMLRSSSSSSVPPQLSTDSRKELKHLQLSCTRQPADTCASYKLLAVNESLDSGMQTGWPSLSCPSTAAGKLPDFKLWCSARGEGVALL